MLLSAVGGAARLNYATAPTAMAVAAKAVRTRLPSAARGLAVAAEGYSPRVGIVGVGGVGSAVGENLARAGHRVVAYCDQNPEAGGRLEELGATRWSTPRGCASQCDVVVTALTTPEVVRACVLGDDGVFAGLRRGGLLLDHSTTDYNQTLEFAAIASANGQQVLEAPITGGLTLLQEGKMTVLVGGEEGILEEHRPLLDASFANVLYMGPMGTATVAKVLSNMFAGAHVVLAGEALMVAKRAGMDMGVFWDAIRLSAGNSYVWETEVGPRPIVNGSVDGRILGGRILGDGREEMGQSGSTLLNGWKECVSQGRLG